ncbi:DUF4064 domain-containing protein [Pseudogracilibacillus sp. SO30301A]|uniref:DUF4064 domain-containing protein n=1 Tax=Pseudogracilibacillus sp. SO30301A TaxID=3098291 RepID=UPI00300E314A
MKTHVHTIVFLSIFTIFLLTTAFISLSSIGPLEQNKTARNLVTSLYFKDPKVQRDAAKGKLKIHPDRFATDVLSYLNPYINYPLIALVFSVLLNVLSLTLLKRNENLAGSLLMCAALASIFTIIPPIIQAISGYVLIEKDKLNTSIP